MDRDGYGARPGQSEIDRLLEDARTLSPAGVERVAEGWRRRGEPAAVTAAEAEAARVLEADGRAGEWQELEGRLRGLTEGAEPLVAWQREHGPVGRDAEEALMAAALALTAGPQLPRSAAATLRRPMGEALPWLLVDSAAPD